ncbi:unnamed protein product [Rotaria sordida]|uniref:Uncharacterized protein n=1 Tax=Rotaria sordida TaxID=392033 RepID=A0A815CCV1_9BILA|nr:unnamed protein product [Rotaria sordida]CAF3844763.1 unnamed protein product [Rotaria sordida]
MFSDTNQLSCFSECHNIKIDISKPFDEPSETYQCVTDARATRCYGRIMIYYNDIDNHQSHISYSFGSDNHIIENEIEEIANENDFKFIIYFLFLVESFDTKELVISAYIVCETMDNCALNYVKILFNLFNTQRNPINQLSKLLYNSNESTILSCYDYKTGKTTECLASDYPTCIINNTALFEQGCYLDANTKLEYVFMITSSKKQSIEKVLELIICNRDSCNDELILKEIEIIIYNHTLWFDITLNNSNKLIFYLLNLISLFIFRNIF